MLPVNLIAMFVAGISAYRYAKAARPLFLAKILIIAVVTITVLIDWFTGRWGLVLMFVQLLVTLFVTLHLQLLNETAESDGARGRTQW